MSHYIKLAILTVIIGYANTCVSVHKCITNSIFEFKNEQYSCVDGDVCNWNNIEPCNPCTPLQFQCSDVDESIVIYDEEEVHCDEYYKCNKDLLPPLEPCIPGVCDGIKSFTCSDDDPKLVTTFFTFKCTDGKICNKNYIAPCTMCIDDNILVSTPSSTVTTPPTISTPPTKSTPSTTSTATTPTTSSSTPSTTTTTSEINYPDCSDGYGLINPCRRGPPLANKYYKCKLYLGLWKYETKNCSYKKYDKVCKDEPVC